MNKYKKSFETIRLVQKYFFYHYNFSSTFLNVKDIIEIGLDNWFTAVHCIMNLPSLPFTTDQYRSGNKYIKGTLFVYLLSITDLHLPSITNKII